jgi:hypothetical protein
MLMCGIPRRGRHPEVATRLGGEIGEGAEQVSCDCRGDGSRRTLHLLPLPFGDIGDGGPHRAELLVGHVGDGPTNFGELLISEVGDGTSESRELAIDDLGTPCLFEAANFGPDVPHSGMRPGYGTHVRSRGTPASA